MDEIVLQGVSKTFARRKAIEPKLVLDRIDLCAARQQVTCLLGPSGCGKTTVLNMVAGFEPVTSGTVSVGGTPVTGISRDRLVVFQQPALFPWRDVIGNVLIGDRAAPVSRTDNKERRAEATGILERMQLAGSEHLYPYQLSGGMRQRVQIARALLCRPRVLLMDEPFGALDAQTRLGLQELMLDIWADAKPTVLFVTHDVDEAILLGHRVIVFSTAPAHIVENFTVSLLEPRSFLSLTSPEFVEAKQRLLAVIHREGALV